MPLPSGLPSRADVPVRCSACGVEVRVGKTSWQQTSVEWPDDGPAHCLELRDAAAPQTMMDRVRTCSALQRSISKAAMTGAIVIPE